MKKFNFKLQRLLDLREMKEEQVKNELAKLVAIQNIERSKQQEFREKIRENYIHLSNRMRQGNFSYKEAMMCERYVDVAHRAIEKSQDIIEQMEPEIQKVRERLIEASRERKVVEKLKERKWEDYLYEYNREMAKEIDDMNQQLHQRQRMMEHR